MISQGIFVTSKHLIEIVCLLHKDVWWRTYHEDVTEKPEWIFWPTHYKPTTASVFPALIWNISISNTEYLVMVSLIWLWHVFSYLFVWANVRVTNQCTFHRRQLLQRLSLSIFKDEKNNHSYLFGFFCKIKGDNVCEEFNTWWWWLLLL